MNILYVTSEAVPFCKTGGLADVAGSLPQSLAANGDRVSVILPLYQRTRGATGCTLSATPMCALPGAACTADFSPTSGRA